MKATDTMVEAIALSSPSGRMSKRARKAASDRLNAQLFPPGYWDRPEPTEADRAVQLRRTAAELRGWAERGMRPVAYRREAARLEAEADRLEGVIE